MKRLGSLQEVKNQVRLVNNPNTTKPSMSFLFAQTVQASEGFNKLYEASSSRRPLSLFVFQAGESLCMTLYWRKIPPQPGPATDYCRRRVERRGGSCWDERVCLCVCSSSGSKAINPVPKCQVACQHASLRHPSFKVGQKGPSSALKWWVWEWGNDDLSYMEKGLAILHRQEGDKGKTNC